MKIGIIGLVIVGIGTCFLLGVCAVAEGCEVLNEHITEWN